MQYKELRGGSAAEGSAEIRERVVAARERQHARFESDAAKTKAAGGPASKTIFANAQMSTRQIRAYCDLGSDAERLLERAMQQQGLSARAHDRILKVARDDRGPGGVAGDRGEAYSRGDPVPDAGPELLGFKFRMGPRTGATGRRPLRPSGQ